MKVLVDTSVWSLALRRGGPLENELVREFAELIDEQRVVMIGSVRQELLSGIRNTMHFDKLRDHLQPFPDLVLTESDYERAAEFFNICRSRGMQGLNLDFLICAVSVNHHLAILTADHDFRRFAEHLPIHLHPVRF